MKTNLIIPTCSSSRTPILIQTIESIQAGSYKDVHIIVVADGNQRIFREVTERGFDNLSIIQNVIRRDWVFSINRVLKEFISEYYIYASDDLIFPHDCIKMAMKNMGIHFSYGDGVVGIGRKGRSAFGLFGNKFVNRFPKREVFCPDFTHFGSDSELLRTVKELDRIVYLPEEHRVEHLRKKDETWRFARRIRGGDREIFHKRQAKGYKWGIDFNLVTRGGK